MFLATFLENGAHLRADIRFPGDETSEERYWQKVHADADARRKDEEQRQNQHREQGKAMLTGLVQEGTAIQPALIQAEAGPVKIATPSLLQRYPDHFLLGAAFTVVLAFGACVFIRHRRGAEVRALCGGYLSDGTEVARYRLPEWFLPAPAPAVGPGVYAAPELAEKPAPVGGEKSLVEKFLEQAPEHLGHIRQALRALGRSGNETEWQAAFLQLPERIAALKQRANFWEMRPVWQMSSALELLARRIAEKPKDATPSTLRTISAACDLLQTLCAPGIRPSLIMNPPVKILAVDDNALCLRAVTFALQKAGFVPDVAENGVKALALATERAYDVIFMDIQMPEMDGLTACKRIHETEANAGTPVVFVTIQSDFHTRAQSTVIGGSDLMAKPFLIFELAVKALTAAMRKRLQLHRSPVPASPELAAGLVSTAPEAARVAIASGFIPDRRRDPAVAVEDIPVAAGTADAADDFLADAKDHLAMMRNVLEEVGHPSGDLERQQQLGDLCLRVHSFATEAEKTGLPLAARVGSTLGMLVKKVFEKPDRATASTLNTIATALDLLDVLRIPGRRQKLADDGPVHLLVVDDEPLARRALTGALQLVFEKPDSAESGAAALALAVQKSYDVIFTDVHMPGLDGFALCAELRTTTTNGTTPVVFITSQDDGDARQKARRSGGNDFIAKPCLPSEIALKALIFVVRKRLQLTDRDVAPFSFVPKSKPSRTELLPATA